MKTVKTILGKTIIVTLTLFFLGIAVTATGSTKAQPSDEKTIICGVSDADVVAYLNSYGYEVRELRIVDGCCDRIAYTQYTYQTRVYIVDSKIIGHEDVPE